MSRKSNLKVRFGNPEHIISAERARELLSNQLKYKPVTKDANMITQGALFRTADGKLDVAKIQEHYAITSDNVNDIADELADKVIRQLEGNTLQFERFTSEAVAVMTLPMFDELAKRDDIGRVADDIDTAINMLPASNGKTFTAVQMLRTEKYMLDEVDYTEACKHTMNEARYPKTWLRSEGKADLKLVAPRGKETIDEVTEIADVHTKAAFNDLSDDQKEAVVNIYENSGKSLDTVLEKLDGESQEVDVFELGMDETPNILAGLSELSSDTQEL